VLAGNSSANHALILEAPNGKTVRVSPNPLLSSAQVVRIEPTDLPGHPRSLRLVLDSAGRFAWMQTRHQHAGELMAVTVDGWFVSIVSLMADGERDDCLILPGPWPETIATSLARRAQLNYEAANNN
jgi:hypothetical protein